VNVGTSPLVERRRLRDELRQARLDAGLTQEVVADAMDWSISKIIRIETGAVGISKNDLTALLRLYKVRDPRRVQDLVTRAREARKQTWYSKYRSVLTATYFQYIEYETSASIIRSYEEIVVPGLLQTEEYAATISGQYRPNVDLKAARINVEVRMKRQELLLGGPNPPLLFFIIDEAAIRRLVGDESLRREQLEKLISMAERPEITIEIVPFTAGLHSGMSNDFSILEFPGVSEDVLYFEGIHESIISRDVTEEVTLYRELFEELRNISLGPKGTFDYLERALSGIR
jgi:transcriptional regulator with XRE-family HTH domain